MKHEEAAANIGRLVILSNGWTAEIDSVTPKMVRVLVWSPYFGDCTTRVMTPKGMSLDPREGFKMKPSQMRASRRLW